jgi:hypothetical protein
MKNQLMIQVAFKILIIDPRMNEEQVKYFHAMNWDGPKLELNDWNMGTKECTKIVDENLKNNRMKKKKTCAKKKD